MARAASAKSASGSDKTSAHLPGSTFRNSRSAIIDSPDTILVSQLELLAHIGVPAAERRAAQRLTVSLRLVPMGGFAGLEDDLANTVDYAAVCDAVRQEAGSRPRRLIETLACDIATLLLSRFPLQAVELELRKYILAGVGHVAVLHRRERPL